MNPFRIAAPLVAAALALPALAQSPSTDTLNAREKKQERRINQGERSGQLTKEEAENLDRGQARIDRMQRDAKADGKVTPEERAAIDRAQDAESRKISAQRHDKQNRNAATGGTGVQSANRENTRRDDREEAQENRIKQGEQSGRLTAAEAARLRKGQEHVRDLENKAEYDGKVTAQERAAIEKAQDEQSKRINAQLKDGERNAATGGSRK
jgi:hypothetical protein